MTEHIQGKKPHPVIIDYSAAACGAGKTYWAMEHIAKRPGSYLVAIDRIDEFDARQKMLLEAFDRLGKRPCQIHAIHTGNCTSVGQRVRDFPKSYRGERIVLFITHAALQRSDLSAYWDWTLVVDEVPTVWFHDSLKTPATWTWFAQHYTLEPIPDTPWSRIKPKAEGPTVAALQEDSMGNDIAVLAARIKDQVSGAYAKLQTWEQSAAEGVSSSEWPWFAIWSPEALRVFGKVIMLGNSITESLTFKLWNEWYSESHVQWREFSLPSTRIFHPRRVTVEYYSKRRATRRYFEEYPEVLQAVADHINATSTKEAHFWSANKNLTDAGFCLNGQQVGPRASGRNDLKDYAEGSFIYAAKPRPDELEILAILGITDQMLIRAREHEDVIQMFGRCSIREPYDRRDILFRVFSMDQAEMLAEHHQGTAHHFELRHIDLSLPGQTLGVPGRPTVGSKPLNAADRKAAQRWRTKMTAAGVSDVRDLSASTSPPEDLIAYINATYEKAVRRAATI